MRRFAEEYPNFPILQVPLAELDGENSEFLQVSLAEIPWYHHITLLGIAQYQTEKLLSEIQSTLPTIEELEEGLKYKL